MIELATLHKETFYLNPNLIESIEKSPDTVITTISGKKFIVDDSPDEIRKRVIQFHHKVHREKYEGLDEEI